MYVRILVSSLIWCRYYVGAWETAGSVNSVSFPASMRKGSAWGCSLIMWLFAQVCIGITWLFAYGLCIGSCDDVQEPMFHFNVPRPVSLSEGEVRERHYMGVAIASCYVGGMIVWIQTRHSALSLLITPPLVGKGSHIGAVLVDTPPLFNDDMGTTIILLWWWSLCNDIFIYVRTYVHSHSGIMPMWIKKSVHCSYAV